MPSRTTRLLGAKEGGVRAGGGIVAEQGRGTAALKTGRAVRRTLRTENQDV